MLLLCTSRAPETVSRREKEKKNGSGDISHQIGGALYDLLLASQATNMDKERVNCVHGRFRLRGGEGYLLGQLFFVF